MASIEGRSAKRARIDDIGSGTSNESEIPSDVDGINHSSADVNDARIIVVLIGEEQRRFAVSKNLITASSPFFRAALRNDFKEAHEREVKLPEAKAPTFEAYLRWLKEGFIDSKGTPETTEDGLFHLYVLADQLQDLRLCNRITDLCLSLWWDDEDLRACDLNNSIPLRSMTAS